MVYNLYFSADELLAFEQFSHLVSAAAGAAATD
jgi:hypothetical protein